MLTTTVGRL